MQAVLPTSKRHQLWAIDLETRGTEAAHPESFIVGIGFADQDDCFYIDLRGIAPEVLSYIWDFLGTARLLAFNVMFDGTFLQGATGKWLNWVGCSYGLFKQMSSEGFTGQEWNLDFAIREILGWDVSNKVALAEALKKEGFSKGDMWRLPTEILGPYCASDADAAWQLWEYLTGVCKNYPFLMEYHTREFLTEVKLLAEQQLRGILVDVPGLTAYRERLGNWIQKAMEGFLFHPDVSPHVAAFNAAGRQAWIDAEPPRFTKTLEVAKRWEAWKARETSLVEFNPNSKIQLETLFYDKLGLKASRFTEGGRRSVDKKILPSLGEPGKLLNRYNLLVKERGYVDAALEKASIDGLIHPQFNSVGTITQRLSGGGGWNFQQQPKTPGYLECLQARPGHKLVQLDFAALEPCVMAEFSQDPALLSLYGPSAKPNDVYLFVASKIPALGKEILKYYDPENPTPEGIAAAKKFCKKDRSIAKLVHLSSSYGAGPAKIHETLTLEGIDISLTEVKKIHTQYWKVFRGIKRWEQQLLSIWRNQGGWVPSISGRPLCVAEGLLKDIVNRHTQASGHDILQLFIWNIDKLRTERGLEWHPWIIDLHDEVLVECPEHLAEAVAQSFVDALTAVNAELGSGVVFKGTPEIVDNLAEVKIDSSDYKAWKESKQKETP